MKFQRIGTGNLIARIAIFTLLLLAGAKAYAVDEDIPPPADSDIPAPRTSLGAAKTPTDSALSEDESIPAPSLGDEALPEPSVDRGQEKAKNQVNKAPEDDEIFLPTPNVNDNVYYAPVGTPAPRVTQEDLDWRYLTTNRPAFSLYTGLGFKGYANALVTQSRYTGYMVGAGIRALSLGQTLFLHAYGDISWYNLGPVGTVQNVSDRTLRYGGMLELGVGRRISLFLTLFRQQTLVSSPSFDGTSTDPLAKPKNLNAHDADNIGEPPSWFLGAGAQYDFYVIPHGSLGIMAQVQRDLYQISLTFAVEPEPRKKLSLNYRDLENAY